MKIAVYGRNFSTDFSGNIRELFRKLKEYNGNVAVFEPFCKFIKEKTGFDPEPHSTFSGYEDFDTETDFVLSIGGDGTILESISLVRDSGIPIIGINSGRLGFLASIAKEEINEAIDNIVKGNYSLEERSLIQIVSPENLFGNFSYCLNEISIQKKNSKMITIHAYLNGDFLNSYWADGLIISTPTGSTAYSLSTGGPIITPDSGVFIISPIAPHNLTVRPLVIPDSNEITLEVDFRYSEFLLSMDFYTSRLENRKKIVLRKAPFTIRLVSLNYQNFYSTIRNKLMWGVDKRN